MTKSLQATFADEAVQPANLFQPPITFQALLCRQGAETALTRKPKLRLQCLLSQAADPVGDEVVNRDLFTLFDIPQRMHRMSLDVRIPNLMRVVVARVIDPAGVEENCSANPLRFDGKGIGTEDANELHRDVLVGMVGIDVVHGEEGRPLVRAEGVNLLGEEVS
jgi:hypothetical protein